MPLHQHTILLGSLPGTKMKKSHHLFCYYCSELQHHTCILCSHLMKYRSYTVFMTNRDNHDGVIHPFMLVFCFTVYLLFILVVIH